MPKDHLAVAVQKNGGGHTRAGAFWRYEYDGVGNRSGVVKRSSYGSCGEVISLNTMVTLDASVDIDPRAQIRGLK